MIDDDDNIAKWHVIFAVLECSYCKRSFKGICYLVCPACREIYDDKPVDSEDGFNMIMDVTNDA